MNTATMTRARRVAGKVLACTAGAAVVLLLALNLVVPRLTRTVPLTVLTGSMSPQMPAGSLVLVRATDADTLEVGDVITFETAPNSGRFVTHRITEVHDDGKDLTFTTKGDANPGADVDRVPEAAVRGRVAWHVPYIGGISDQLRSPSAVGVVVLGSGLMFGISTLRERKQRRRADGGPVESGGAERLGSPVLPLPISADGADIVVRQVLLARVRGHHEVRAGVTVLAHSFGGSLVSIDDVQVTVSVAATPDVLDQLEDLLVPWPDRRVVRSSIVVLDREDVEVVDGPLPARRLDLAIAGPHPGTDQRPSAAS